MTRDLKPAESVGIDDLRAHAVWKFVNRDDLGETLMRPVRHLPVTNLTGKIVGTQVRLASGALVWGALGNVEVHNARSTQHFILLTVFGNGQRFVLSRYFDFDYEENGPAALAQFLGLPIDDVFPITYDIRDFSGGDPAALAAQIHKEPRERLSRTELMALAVP